MVRNSDDDAGAPEAVLSLGRRHLGMGASVHYAPSIPPDKLENARKIHDLHLPEAEPVLVLYDGTLFGSAEEGFLVTPRRLCWKNLWEHPRQIEWDEIDPGTISRESGKVLIARGEVTMSGELVHGAASFFLAMTTARLAVSELGPYRAPEAALLLEGAAIAGERLLALARTRVGEVNDVHYHPSIPAAKERHARAVHKAHLPVDEPVIVLYDDTVFGSAEEGFVLTGQRLCWKNLTDHPATLPWSAIEPESVSVNGSYLLIMGGSMQFSARSELIGPVADLIRRAAEEARAGSRRD